MKKVIIRVDAYKEIGIGHLTRCLALASMLRNHFSITFLCQEKDLKTLQLIKDQGFVLKTLPVQTIDQEIPLILKLITKDDIVVIDGYQFSKSYQESLRKHCHSLIYIDDLNNGEFSADLIINHNLHATHENYQVQPEAKVLKGADYLLLRSEFFEENRVERNLSSDFSSILVCMGGADRENLTLFFAQELSKFFKGKITLIIGSAYAFHKELEDFCQKFPQFVIEKNLSARSLVERLKSHGLLICTSSMIASEACAVGIPMVLGYMEKNQEKIAHLFHQKGLAFSLGNLMNKQFHLKEVLGNVNREKQLAAQAQFIDKQSPKRVLSEFKHIEFKKLKIASERFHLRTLTTNDVTNEYVLWFDDQSTKKFIVTAQKSNTKEKLMTYVLEKITKADVLFLGIFDNETNQHVGNIKFEPIDWEKSYTIMGILIGNPAYRGKGVAGEILDCTAKFWKEQGLKKMVLGVEDDNLSAIKSYEKIGFKKTSGLYIKFKESDNSTEMILEL